MTDTLTLHDLLELKTLVVDTPVLVKVEKEHIKNGMVKSEKFNAISLAIKDMLNGKHKVSVDSNHVTIDEIPFELPMTASVMLRNVYSKRQKEAFSFNLTLSPSIYKLVKPQCKDI